MTDGTTKQSTNPTVVKPYLLGYTERPSDDGKQSYWSKIAIAWAHKDGQGYNIQMDALPVDGKLVLRTVNDDNQPTSEFVERTPGGVD